MKLIIEMLKCVWSASVCRAAGGGLCLFLLGLLWLPAGEIDRLLVAVNGSVITEGDLYMARGFNAIVSDGGKRQSASREEEIDRLIDVELIRQELRNLRIEFEDKAVMERRISELRKRYTGGRDITQSLEKYGLTEAELDSFLRLRIMVETFLDFRFRPFVSISEDNIKDYYRNRLEPQLKAAGSELPPLAEVSEKIREILTEEAINTELDDWIEDTRRSARIEYFYDRDPDIP